MFLTAFERGSNGLRFEMSTVMMGKRKMGGGGRCAAIKGVCALM